MAFLLSGHLLLISLIFLPVVPCSYDPDLATWMQDGESGVFLKDHSYPTIWHTIDRSPLSRTWLCLARKSRNFSCHKTRRHISMMILLLMLSGDVEMNPGPVTGRNQSEQGGLSSQPPTVPHPPHPEPTPPSSMLDDERSRMFKQYYDGLKRFYRNLPTVAGDGITPDVQFNNLGTVERKRYGAKREKDISDFVQATIYGIDRYWETSEKIDYEDILNCGGVIIGKRVVISGASGCGKTTFSRKLCKDLYSQSLPNQYCLVLLVELRRVKVYLDSVKGDINLKFLLQGSELNRNSYLPELCQSLEDSDGEGVALILDGFDEIADQLGESPFLSNLLSSQCSYLSKCDVFVTTQPSRCPDLISLIQQPHHHVEILGFTDADIDGYIKSFFTGVYPEDRRKAEDMSKTVILRLGSLPSVRRMCHIPVVLKIVCEIQDHLGGEPLPKTLSDVFAMYICHRLVNWLGWAAHHTTDQIKVSDVLHVPSDLFPEFYPLCTVAFRCCINGQRLILTDDDLVDVKMYLYGRGSIYNLLFPEPVIEALTIVGYLYQFNHKMVQETMAAIHIARLCQEDQKMFWKKAFHIPDMAGVWNIYRNLTKPPIFPEDKINFIEEFITAAIERDGYVQVQIVKCVILGPPEAGKTQLKRALSGDVDESTESSPASTSAEVVMECYIDGQKKWEKLDHAKYRSALYQTVKMEKYNHDYQSVSQPQVESLISKIEMDRLPLLSSTVITTGRSDSKIELAEAATLVSPKTNKAERNPLPDKPFVNENSSIEGAFNTLKNNVLSNISRTTGGEHLNEVRMIHIIDSGGQPAFFDFHPVIATSRAVYLIVYNSEEGLDAFPKITYRSREFACKVLANPSQNNLDMIKRSLHTLHYCKEKLLKIEKEMEECLNIDSSTLKSDNVLSVIIVGSRKQESQHRAEDISSAVKSNCCTIPTWRHTQKKVTLVNSLNRSCDGVDKLRRALSDSKSKLKMRIPLSWFHCQLTFLSAAEDSDFSAMTYHRLLNLCTQGTSPFVSSNKEFLAMLTTFHMLGIFNCPDIDHTDVDPNNTDKLHTSPVFTKPDVLYKYVTRILEIPFYDCESDADCEFGEVSSQIEDLQRSGFLTAELLAVLGVPDKLGLYEGFHSYLLDCLLKWGLAAEVPGDKRQLFIPSVLPTWKEREFIPKDQKTSIVTPLAFTCKENFKDSSPYYVPQGLFPHFVVSVMSHHGNGYDVLVGQGEATPRCRDVIVFTKNRGTSTEYSYNIYTVDNIDHISIWIIPAREDTDMRDTDADYGIIVRDLLDSMKQAYSRLFRDTVHSPVILCSPCNFCPQAKQKKTAHLAYVDYNDDPIVLYCLSPERNCIHDKECDKKLEAILKSAKLTKLTSDVSSPNTPEDDNFDSLGCQRRSPSGSTSSSTPSTPKARRPRDFPASKKSTLSSTSRKRKTHASKKISSPTLRTSHLKKSSSQSAPSPSPSTPRAKRLHVSPVSKPAPSTSRVLRSHASKKKPTPTSCTSNPTKTKKTSPLPSMSRGLRGRAQPKTSANSRSTKASFSQKKSDNKDVIKSTSDLLPYMDKMIAHLTLLGTVLGIENRTSAVVNGPGNFEEKCIDILSHWLKVTPHPTWTMFCDRLKRAKTFNNLRSKICRDKSC